MKQHPPPRHTRPNRIAMIPAVLAAGWLIGGTGLAQQAPDPDPAQEIPTEVETPPGTEDGPLRVEITQGIIEPTEIALPRFHDEGGAGTLALAMRRVIVDDLTGTGLFHEIPLDAQLDERTSFDASIRWQSWRAIHADALVTGAVARDDQRITLKFRLHDVASGEALGAGMRFDGKQSDWRRIAHKAADQIYSRLTGEGPYLDSRIVFVAESGPRDVRTKGLAIMDHDGANRQDLTDGHDLVLSPQLSPDGRSVVFTSFANGMPRIALLSLDTGRTKVLQSAPGTMSFAPAWSPDGRWIVYSQEEAGITNLWLMDAATGAARVLTGGTSIDTAPSFSPDGKQIVFESDRSGAPQLYVLSLTGAEGGAARPETRRISFGEASYGTPAWSPRGDLIAFSKRADGDDAADFAGKAQPSQQIGIMRPDGNGERILTHSHLDEGPSWSPNGRVLIFTRQERGGTGQAWLHSVDVAGRNLGSIPRVEAASDPHWGPLRR